MENFEIAVGFVFEKEGGYVNDKTDPGGETNMGITLPTLTLAIAAGLVPKGTTVFSLTKEQAKKIYLAFYWITNILDSLPWPYAAAALDTYVQHSEPAARKMVQDAYDDVRKLLEARRVYYLSLIAKNPALGKYKRGWMNRINDLAKFCTMEEQILFT